MQILQIAFKTKKLNKANCRPSRMELLFLLITVFSSSGLKKQIKQIIVGYFYSEMTIIIHYNIYHINHIIDTPNVYTFTFVIYNLIICNIYQYLI